MNDSPCNNVCIIDTESGLCVGCNRTQEEITNWTIFSDHQKKLTLLEIKNRN